MQIVRNTIIVEFCTRNRTYQMRNTKPAINFGPEMIAIILANSEQIVSSAVPEQFERSRNGVTVVRENDLPTLRCMLSSRLQWEDGVGEARAEASNYNLGQRRTSKPNGLR